MNASNSPPTLAPPVAPGPLEWLRKNLFSNWFNAVLTLASLVFLYFTLVTILRWALFSADWQPVIYSPLLFLVGQYPRAQLWRPGLSLLIGTFLIGMSWGLWERYIKPFAIFFAILLTILAIFPLKTPTITLSIRAVFLASPVLIILGYRIGRLPAVKGKYVITMWLLAAIFITLVLLPGLGNIPALPKIATTSWGGLLITLLLAVGGITLSFPIGVLLALGRRSSLTVVKLFSIFFIETIRGVPLVTVLFMFSIILALFLPAGSRIDRIVRALLAMVFFSSAYTAENVRGGLQAVPPGQAEAAKALGLSNFQITTFIVLPQALRLVIPTIVGQFISLFKDTTLVVIVGINDLLGISNAVLNLKPQFVHLQLEVYLFVAVIFWIFSYFMSYTSRELEKSLGIGKR
ncbi:MAG: amino acid ABC transporter permease [Anaerolineales bacterium]|nr:amino acid ABC transporter permease [Anaerolineales bacterium]